MVSVATFNIAAWATDVIVPPWLLFPSSIGVPCRFGVGLTGCSSSSAIWEEEDRAAATQGLLCRRQIVNCGVVLLAFSSMTLYYNDSQMMLAHPVVATYQGDYCNIDQQPPLPLSLVSRSGLEKGIHRCSLHPRKEVKGGESEQQGDAKKPCRLSTLHGPL